MTVFVFAGSLIGAMMLGMPIAFALIVCGLALMLFMGNFDAQIVAQNLVSGADSFPLLAVPFFLLAGAVVWLLFVLSGQMAVAYWMAHAPKSPFPVANGGDAAILFCFVFLYLVFAGPGPWSLDAALGREPAGGETAGAR